MFGSRNSGKIMHDPGATRYFYPLRIDLRSCDRYRALYNKQISSSESTGYLHRLLGKVKLVLPFGKKDTERLSPVQCLIYLLTVPKHEAVWLVILVYFGLFAVHRKGWAGSRNADSVPQVSSPVFPYHNSGLRALVTRQPVQKKPISDHVLHIN
jgi:hypothetical protein